MFMRIVQQVNGLLTGLYTRLSLLVKERLLPSAKQLLASITQAFQNVASLLSQLAPTTLNIKAWPAPSTIVARSIKAVLTTAKLKLSQIGSQLLTTVASTNQPVVQAPQRKRGRPVGSTKSAQSRSKGTSSAQTRTALQSTQDGVKSPGRVGLPHQRAKSQRKKGN